MASVGRSWEILRRNVPVSPGSKTRVVDLFTSRTAATHTTLITVAPQYGVGLPLMMVAPTAGISPDSSS